MEAFDFQSRTRVLFRAGALDSLGTLARELKFTRTLLVADGGLVEAGYVDRARELLIKEDVEVFAFHDFDVNPDESMIERGRRFAASLKIDSIIGLGGGSSLDCAKGINFLLTCGGRMRDYQGYGKATRPLLPMIAVPTTSGTGSEAQSYALISDATTHEKMACGDPSAAFRIAILDPLLTVSQPASVTAQSGFDAIAHAVETYVTTKRNALSDLFSREAWRLLEANYERVLAEPENLEARGAMQLGAYFAGLAIENSMLGATHACANPLTSRYGTTHGAAIAVLLPSVVRWNAEVAGARYAELLRCAINLNGFAAITEPGDVLARRLEQLAAAGKLKVRLGEMGVAKSDLPSLAEDAAEQWTGRFNPRPFDKQGALEVYRCAY
ncbi:MAG TPA: iron-containing alcohol dehydrogenase [Pyrinomonadaceae bacterium]|jgi:alcohol dehydrogenase|nr:iron-containing alcohol dehydrogenase [Pyrinomonadaceae bacterium]